ncbi:MAG: efflux RND transporter permease subunit [Fibrobacteres bacterium]|nr:efflux RND transporter permease subunit [Fibrobacterota bacterium]
MEQSLNGIDGIRTMSSQSRDERTQITVEFLLGVDLERAANDVRDRVSRASAVFRPMSILPPWVELGAENEKTRLRLGTEPGIALAFVAQPGANQVSIVDQVRKRLPRLVSELPEGVVLEEVFDNTRFVRKALLEVGETIAIAFALVVLVIFLFLREWRTTLVPVLTVPVSLVGVFACLGTGVLHQHPHLVGGGAGHRNRGGRCHRRAGNHLVARGAGGESARSGDQRTGRDLRRRGRHHPGAGRRVRAVVVLQGFTGRLFREFSVVVGGSVLISGFVALTLSAMLSSRVLRPHSRHGRFYPTTEPFYQWLTDYSRILRKSLRFPSAAVAVLALCAGAIFLLLGALPKELAPAEDRSALQINATAHEGATFPYMDSWMRRMADSLATVPQIKTYLVNSGAGGAGGATNSGFARVVLSEPTERGAPKIRSRPW